jgi:subtilisin family serine protease
MSILRGLSIGIGLLVAALPLVADAGLGRAPRDSYLPATTADSGGEQIYIVQLEDPPALSYRGGRSGLAATRPTPGQRFQPDDPDVQAYGRYLSERHDQVLRSVHAWHGKLYSYRYAFNGFAARLTELQARKLRAQRGVVNVWADQVRYLQTNASPSFLGLFDADGGLRADLGLQGEDVVIGVIDSGITPEHPSFVDRREADIPGVCRSSWAESSLLGLWLCTRWRRLDDEIDYDPPQGWNGRCETGERFEATACNNKLIGARYYIDGFLQDNFLDENEIVSPRDADGHGTHIASTAAGREVRATIAGTDIARISGMAPRARIAVYKACWLEPGQTRGSCSTSDLQRAIEDAVADGVDIINYSIGNTDIGLSDPDDLALLAASDAGVLSVVAAGNDGPTPGTILSPAGAPWVLTVGASSRQGSEFDEALRVNSPAGVADDYVAREASFTPPLRDAGTITDELVLTDDGVQAPGGSDWDACEPLQNAGEISGRIAFLQRGVCTFEQKLINVEDAGAIAAVVFDNQGDPIVMSGTRGSVDIPAVMISQADGQRLLDSLQAGSAIEVTLDKGLFIERAEDGNVMGSFSSRGPNLTAPDVLKPDVTAPGVNILAGQTPDVANGIRGENFQYLSGTSMAVPHVAGLAALLLEAHPDWSPAAVRSALMTTARQDVLKQDRATAADPFDIGAGHVAPNAAVEPGLVYDAGKPDYDAFICGNGNPRVSSEECEALEAAGYPTGAADLNLPSITLSNLVSRRTVRRLVTNVGAPAQYRASVEAPAGVAVEVSPSTLSLGAGETGEYTVSFASTGAELYQWQFGSIAWQGGPRPVRSPVAVRPVPFLAPLLVSARGMTGTLSFDVEFGYTGLYSAQVHGLTAADVAGGIVQDDPLNNYVFEPDTSRLPDSVARFQFDVAPDQAYLRVALFNEDTDGDDDLDLYVYYCPGLVLCSLVGVSGEPDSDEQVDVLFPGSGEYFVDVHGYNTDPASGGAGARFDLSVWIFGEDDDRGNLAITAPSSARAGETATVDLSWENLERQRYLGGVSHSDASDLLELTVVEIFP